MIVVFLIAIIALIIFDCTRDHSTRNSYTTPELVIVLWESENIIKQIEKLGAGTKIVIVTSSNSRIAPSKDISIVTTYAATDAVEAFLEIINGVIILPVESSWAFLDPMLTPTKPIKNADLCTSKHRRLCNVTTPYTILLPKSVEPTKPLGVPMIVNKFVESVREKKVKLVDWIDETFQKRYVVVSEHLVGTMVTRE
jgi:hypothetical protein